jgi:cytidine deaminase
MKKIEIMTVLKKYDSVDEMNEPDKLLIADAEKAANLAYAPYSGFKVGVTMRLQTGNQVVGSNQENASFPVGICAERVALANLSSQYPGASIETVAIYAGNISGRQPAAPCGMCRQALYEQELRQQSPIRILLKGNDREIWEIDSVKSLLPLAFSFEHFK